MKVTYAVAFATILVALVSATPPESCPAHNDKYPIILPNPDDLATFYICHEGRPFLKRCPKGLFFNPQEKVCDWPSNVIPTTEPEKMNK